jgi:hypothetical protein
MDALQLVTRAVSLGDAETLAQHPASMTHSTYTPEERAAHGISDGLVRCRLGWKTLKTSWPTFTRRWTRRDGMAESAVAGQTPGATQRADPGSLGRASC